MISGEFSTCTISSVNANSFWANNLFSHSQTTVVNHLLSKALIGILRNNLQKYHDYNLGNSSVHHSAIDPETSVFHIFFAYKSLLNFFPVNTKAESKSNILFLKLPHDHSINMNYFVFISLLFRYTHQSSNNAIANFK